MVTASGNRSDRAERDERIETLQAQGDELDAAHDYLPNAMCGCGGEVVIDAEPRCRRQVFDLPEVAASVVEHRLYSGVCAARRQPGRAGDPPVRDLEEALVRGAVDRGNHFRPMILGVIGTAERLGINACGYLRRICTEQIETGRVTNREVQSRG